MEYKEFSGKTVDNAITEACEYYTIPSYKLDYEIIENGSTGFLGIGAKPAIIRAKVMDAKNASKKENKKESPKKDKEVKENKEEKTEPKVLDAKAIEARAAKARANASKKDSAKKEEVKIESRAKAEKRKVPVNVDEVALKSEAEKFLSDVFASMNIEVSIKSEYFASEGELEVELSGPEMGVLIGKRGQTLDSLQYLTSLVVNKESGSYIRVKVDTEDYRRRRKDTLENLAKNLSYKVKRTKRSVSLEPMNPYERRIIHSALQGDKFVTTHSEGEEPYRRVVITPKRGER